MKSTLRNSIFVTAALFLIGAAAAHEIDRPLAGQTVENHLLGTGDFGSIELVSILDLRDPAHLFGDVAVSPDGNWAFLTNRSRVQNSANKKTSGPGVWVIDIANVASPQLAAFIPSDKDTRPGEGLQAVALTTPFFSGTLLVLNSEPFDTKGRGGIALYNVTNPRDPQKLAEHFVAKSNVGLVKDSLTDSAYAWDAGEKAYAVMSFAGTTAFVVLDITRPEQPREVATYYLEDFFPGGIDQPALGLTETQITDIVVKAVDSKFVMLISAGDAGHVLLDVTQPQAVSAIAQTDYSAFDPQLLESAGIALAPEGNAHYAEFTANNQFLIGTDQDFNPFTGTQFNGWGYVHLYNATPVNGYLQQLDTYAIPEAHDHAYASGFGDLTVHEVATHPHIANRAYLAYRQGGFRQIEIQQSNPSSPESAELVEIGGYLGALGNDFWGVDVTIKNGVTYIVASDRETGLYIFRDTSAGP